MILNFIKRQISMERPNRELLITHLINLNNIIIENNNNFKRIFKYLNQSPVFFNSNLNNDTKLKGDVFEFFIAYLYETNSTNIFVKILGGSNDKGIDLELYRIVDKKIEEFPFQYIQCKNQFTISNIDDVINDLNKMKYEKTTDRITNLQLENQFHFLSLNGFVKNTYNEKIKEMFYVKLALLMILSI